MPQANKAAIKSAKELPKKNSGTKESASSKKHDTPKAQDQQKLKQNADTLKHNAPHREQKILSHQRASAKQSAPIKRAHKKDSELSSLNNAKQYKEDFYDGVTATMIKKAAQKAAQQNHNESDSEDECSLLTSFYKRQLQAV